MVMLMNTTTLCSLASPLLPSPENSKTPTRNFPLQTNSQSIFIGRRKSWTLQLQKPIYTVSSSPSENNRTVTVTQSGAQSSASDIVMRFYRGINGHDLASVEDLIAENCVYEDLMFPRPFVGRQAVLEFFKKFIESISTDLQFVIEDISEEGSLAVGVTWHLEWKGKPFPFSKGCSFYKMVVSDNKKQIIYGRDIVEPAIKPGEAALSIIRGVAWLLERFPQLADQLK